MIVCEASGLRIKVRNWPGCLSQRDLESECIILPRKNLMEIVIILLHRTQAGYSFGLRQILLYSPKPLFKMR